MSAQRNSTAAKPRNSKESDAGIDPFMYLMRRFQRARKPAEKTELAFQLLPYLRPKLRSVELSQASPLEIVVEFGGDE